MSLLSKLVRGQKGVSLVETVVALAILAAIGVTFLSGLATTSKAVALVDEQATAESIAWSQMETVKHAGYVAEAATYAASPIPADKDYLNYSVAITAQPLHNPDDGIQKIRVTVSRSGAGIMTVEGYKVNR
jgi:type II secretory pathway pseudopilin PulG